MTNFTLQDAAGSARAAVGFLTILLCPGYVIGSASDLFDFRSRSLRERLAWSVALSFSVAPIFTALAGRVVGISGVALCAGLCAAGTLWLLVSSRQKLKLPRDKHLWMLAGFLMFGAAIVLLELLDFQFGSRLHLSVTVLDQGYRVGFTNAVARSGVPPQNPFYHPSSSSTLRYYYFWYALCAVCMKVAHVSARQALIASSIWSGIGISSMIALYMRHFLRVREGVNRHILTATLLLTVTGMDLFPVFYNMFVNHDFGGETEWWSADQVSSWLDTILWVPNHTASLIACLTVLLLLWRTMERFSRRQKGLATIVAAVAAASAFGLSIYVTAGLAMMMISWSLRLWFQEKKVNVVKRMAGSAALGLVLLTPYLHDLVAARSGTEGRNAAGPSGVLEFSFRRMIDAELITRRPELAGLQAAHPVLLDQAVRLLLLVPGYILELGFFGVVLVIVWRGRKRLNHARSTALFMAVAGLIVVSVLRSSVIGNNDFGYRAVLLPCFFLLLLGAETLLDMQDGKVPEHKVRGAVLTLLILLGLCGTAFQAQALRFYVPMHSANRIAGFEGLAEAVYDTRTAYARADRLVARDAIMQSNPSGQASYFYVANLLFAVRPMLLDAAVDCGAVFGGDPGSCVEMQEEIRRLFNSGGTADTARRMCTRYGAQYLVASSQDAAWRDTTSWVWTLPRITGPAAPGTGGSGTVRIVKCGWGP